MCLNVRLWPFNATGRRKKVQVQQRSLLTSSTCRIEKATPPCALLTASRAVRGMICCVVLRRRQQRLQPLCFRCMEFASSCSSSPHALASPAQQHCPVLAACCPGLLHQPSSLRSGGSIRLKVLTLCVAVVTQPIACLNGGERGAAAVQGSQAQHCWLAPSLADDTCEQHKGGQ